jgi:hypothetical protein
VEANTAIPGDEATRITVGSEDVGFVVVAGGADVVGPCDFAKLGMLECPGGALDEWRRHVFVLQCLRAKDSASLSEDVWGSRSPNRLCGRSLRSLFVFDFWRGGARTLLACALQASSPGGASHRRSVENLSSSLKG